MPVNAEQIGRQIAALRKAKGLTQNDLSQRLNISFQAVSKWERGETLPDIAILVDLAGILETTVDNILMGGQKAIAFKGKRTAKDAIEAVSYLQQIGHLAGRDNAIYRMIIEGLSEKMNTDIAPMLDDECLKECLAAEIIIQSIIAGYYFDLTEVKGQFKHERWYPIVFEYAKKYGIV